MGQNVQRSVLAAAITALGFCGAARAGSLLDVSVLGSLTGLAGTYSNSVIGVPGTTIYYEVVAQSAPAGTVNANTTKKPNGTSDSFSSLNTFDVTAGSSDTFDTATGASFSTGTGASAGTINGDTVSGVRTITSGGAYINDDTAQVLVSGTLTVGSLASDSIFATEDTTSSSALKVGGTSPLFIVGANSTTETSADPLLSFAGALTINGAVVTSVPTPSALSGVSVLGSAMLVGGIVRRRSMIA